MTKWEEEMLHTTKALGQLVETKKTIENNM